MILLLVLYCTYVFLSCSTYFLIRMCELSKIVDTVHLTIKSNIQIKVKILHWEPSGDIFVTFSLQMLYLLLTYFLKIIDQDC